MLQMTDILAVIVRFVLVSVYRDTMRNHVVLVRGKKEMEGDGERKAIHDCDYEK